MKVQIGRLFRFSHRWKQQEENSEEKPAHNPETEQKVDNSAGDK